ncbi:hypothetical protein DSECCO2_305890 [anaerobic digester metagenome]
MIIGADEQIAPTPDAIEAVLEFLPVFEDPHFLPEVVVAEEKGWIFEQYSREVYEFEKTLYRAGFIVRFDWARWEPVALRFFREPGRLDAADMSILRRLLTFHIRKNVACEGHLAEMLRAGHVQAILRRLETLSSGGAEMAGTA